MTDYTDLLALAISKTGYATPVGGGDNPIDNDEVIEYLNDAFSHMSKPIGGHEAYIEFTITAGGVITVTVPATGGPTVALIAPPLLSFPSYSISDAFKINKIENLTTGIGDTYSRLLFKIPYNQREYARAFEDSDEYFRWVDYQAKRGIVLLPKTITLTNTIAVTYGAKFIRFAVTDSVMIAGAAARDLLVRNAASNFTGNDGTTKHFVVQIVNGDPVDPNTFRWSNDGGVTYSGAIAITTAAQTLEDGFTITFPATTGQIANDAWEWYATAPLLTPFEDEEMREYPVEYAAAMTMKDLKQMEWGDSYGYARSLLTKFLRDREEEDSGMYYSVEY